MVDIEAHDGAVHDLPDLYAQFADQQGVAATEIIARLDSSGGCVFRRAEAAESGSVGTNLPKIPVEEAPGLLRHAYTLTMANCHVLLGYPLLDIPMIERARAWVS